MYAFVDEAIRSSKSENPFYMQKFAPTQTRGVVKSVTDSKGWVYGESKSFNGWRREEVGGGRSIQLPV